MVPTLNQQLGSLPTESRVEMFFLCRKDYPLPPPINRGGFHGLSWKKIGSKVDQKPAFLPRIFPFLSSVSSLSLSLHRDLSHATSAPLWSGAARPSPPTHPTVVNNNDIVPPLSSKVFVSSLSFTPQLAPTTHPKNNASSTTSQTLSSQSKLPHRVW